MQDKHNLIFYPKPIINAAAFYVYLDWSGGSYNLLCLTLQPR